MIAIIAVAGEDEEFVDDVACVVIEAPNRVRICKEGQGEDRYLDLNEWSPKVKVSVVPG